MDKLKLFLKLRSAKRWDQDQESAAGPGNSFRSFQDGVDYAILNQQPK